MTWQTNPHTGEPSYTYTNTTNTPGVSRQAEIDLLKNEISILQAEDRVLNAKVSILDMQVKDANAEKDKLAQAFDDLNTTVREATEEIKDHVDSIQQGTALVAQQRDEAISKNKGLSEQLRDRDEEIYRLRDQLYKQRNNSGILYDPSEVGTYTTSGGGWSTTVSSPSIPANKIEMPKFGVTKAGLTYKKDN